MHPILDRRLRFSLFLAPWVPVCAILVAVLVLVSPRPISHALAFVGPLTMVYASICLSAWWVCRAHPLESTPPSRVATTIAGSALVAAGFWLVLASGWATVLSSSFGIGPGRNGL